MKSDFLRVLNMKLLISRRFLMKVMDTEETAERKRQSTKAGGMSTVTLNEDGTEDAVDSDDGADFDMADDFDDDYGDGNSDEY